MARAAGFSFVQMFCMVVTNGGIVRIVKRIFKTLVLIGIGLLILQCVVYVWPDTERDPELVALLANPDTLPVEDNGVIAMLGLVAPENEQDPYGWARAKLKPDVSGDNFSWNYNVFVEHYAAVDGWKHLDAECFYAQYWPPQQELAQGTCAFLEQASEEIKKRQLWIKRYRSLAAYDAFTERGLVGISGQALIKIHTLIIADMIAHSAIDPDAAIKMWIEDARLHKTMLSADLGVITRVVLAVNYRMTQQALPYILASREGLAAEYAAELREVLGPFGPKQMHVSQGYVPQMVHVLRMGEWNLPNRHMNRIYADIKEVAALENVSAKDFGLANARMRAKSGRLLAWRDWHSPVLGLKVNSIAKTVAMDAIAYEPLHNIDAMNRLLALYVDALIAGVGTEGMQAFSAVSGHSDPYTEKPFVYDHASHTLSFVTNDTETTVRLKMFLTKP